MQRLNNTKLNEKGFASIVIALILIIILALFTIGFAQLARREQQTALDKQKATQANYAAESGINDAYKDIMSGAINDANTSGAYANKCLTGATASSGTKSLPAGALTAKQNINNNTGVGYTCLLVQLNTDTLQFNNVLPNSGRHMLFTTKDPLNNLTISWGSATGRTTFAPNLDPANPTLPPIGNWSYPPVVEFSLTPIPPDLSTKPDPNGYLRDNTFTFYAYPSSGGSNSVNFDPANQGQVVSGDCSGSGSYPCSVNLNNLGGNQFVLHFTDYYDSSNILMCANTATCPGSGGTTFSGEPVIDVTGKARDVLKRLRVRVLINNGQPGVPDDNAPLPNGAIEAQNLCKRIQAGPAVNEYAYGSTYDPPTGVPGSVCSLSN